MFRPVRAIFKSCNTVQDWIRLSVLILSLFLVGFITVDAFRYDDPFYQQPLFIRVQFWICLFFLFDIAFEFVMSKHKVRHFVWYLGFFLLCIPYLTILPALHIEIPENIKFVLRMLPLIRSGYALTIVVGWITVNRASQLFMTYLLVLCTGIYFCSLVFFVYEVNVNPLVRQYTDALWWAAMDAVTVGCNIEAVTPVGKVLSVVAAALGIMMVPVFTVYITNAISVAEKYAKTVRRGSGVTEDAAAADREASK
jgi:hypothetical protein